MRRTAASEWDLPRPRAGRRAELVTLYTPPQLPSVVLAPTALQRGVCPDSHAGESLRRPEPWEGARGLEWGVEGGATEEPSTAGPVPIRPAPRLVAPEGHWPCGRGQSSAWRASEVATEETLANA